MKPTLRIVAFAALLVAAAGSGAHAAQPKPTHADAAPPPSLDDPGVTSKESTPAQDAVAPAHEADADPLAPLPKPDARLVRDKASRDASSNTQRIADSDVTTRKEGNDTVQEYRQRGHVWMIKIVPQNGPTQTFLDNDGSGRLSRDAKEGPVSPVYYTLYEWK